MHKWAKEITHFINGGWVESYRTGDVEATWETVYFLTRFDHPEYEFRIKPQKKTIQVAVYIHREGGVPFICHPDVISLVSTKSKYKQLSDIITIEYEDLP